MTIRRDLVWQQLDLAARAGVAHQYARYALGVQFSDLPAEVIHQAKRCLLDALGCALGGRSAPAVAILEDTVSTLGGSAQATIFGSGARTTTLHAALVNSAMVRFLDYNDLGGGGHNSDALASILAVAEQRGSSGVELLTALVVSYELGARFGLAATSAPTGTKVTSSLEDKGWTKDIRAGLNQPPALGRLMHLSEDQIANAIGICLSHTIPLGILDAHREENVMAKNIRFGWAAHDAILACLLAEGGFTGPLRIVESDVGIRQVVAQGELDLERLTDFGGWRVLDVRFKALAANASTHGHVMATLAIVAEHDLKPEDVQSVRILAPVREVRHTTTAAKKYPRNAESADHSAFYANAIAIKERSFGPDAIVPEKFTDPVVLDLIERISVEVDPTLTYYQGISEITTRDGRVLRHRVEVPHGLGDDPLSDAELETKFREMGERVMPAGQLDRLIETIWQAEALDGVQPLVDLMVFDASRPS